MKNIKITQAALALLTSATIMLTTGSCASQNNEKNNTIATSNMDNTTTYIDETEVLTEKVYATNKEGQTYTSPNGQAATEVKTVVVTKPRVIVNSDGSTTIVTVPSSNKVNNSVTKQITTKKVTTTKKPSTTKKSTTTKKPVTATSLTVSNINNVEVFKEFASQMAENTRGGFGGIWKYEYNNKQYTAWGADTLEFRLILAILNYDYLNTETLKSLFGSCSLDDLKRFTHVTGNLSAAVNIAKKANNNWDNLVIDKKICSELKKIESSFLNYINGKNKQDFNNMIMDEKKDSNAVVRTHLGYFACILYFDYDYEKFPELSYNSTEIVESAELELEEAATKIYNRIKNKIKIYS